MYMDEYKRWMEAELEDFDLKAELQSIEGDEDAIAELIERLERELPF